MMGRHPTPMPEGFACYPDIEAAETLPELRSLKSTGLAMPFAGSIGRPVQTHIPDAGMHSHGRECTVVRERPVTKRAAAAALSVCISSYYAALVLLHDAITDASREPLLCSNCPVCRE